MSDAWSIRVSTWKTESPAKQYNELARTKLDQIDFGALKNELKHYLYGLYNTEGPNIIQSKRAEGVEDIPVLLAALETMKRYKVRIRAIGIDMFSFKTESERMYDMVKKTLSLKPEFQELKNADQRDTVISLVVSDLVEFMESAEEIISIAKLVGQEYNDAFNALDLEYKMLNTMAYARGLFPMQGTPGAPNVRTY